MEQIKPDKRYILAQPEDLSLNLSLKSSFNDLNEFNITKVVSLVDLFNKERNESTKYRIYGNINYFSFLRNKIKTANTIVDLFNDSFTTTGFNLEDFFDIKLFRPISPQSYINQTNNYIEQLSLIPNNNNCRLNFFGYSRNIYGEKIYNFKFDAVNVDPYELIKINNDIVYNNNLYLGFIPKFDSNYKFFEKIIDTNDFASELTANTKYGYIESAFTANTVQIIDLLIVGSEFDSASFEKYFKDKLKNFLKIYNLEPSISNITNNLRFIKNYLDIGNGDYKTKIPLNFSQTVFSGGLINFNKETYTISEKIKKEYIFVLSLVDTYQGLDTTYNDWINQNNYSAFTYTEQLISSISLPLSLNLVTYKIYIDFSFKFNPFYKIELKKYDSIATEIFSGLSSTSTPPITAVVVKDKIIWKDLLEYGDPDNYDNPFVNNTHYFFNDINFYLKPDFSSKNTTVLLNEFTINFTNNDFKFNRDNINLTPKTKKEIC
jgi:hypothetical protein